MPRRPLWPRVTEHADSVDGSVETRHPVQVGTGWVVGNPRCDGDRMTPGLAYPCAKTERTDDEL